uniref:DUF3153 domain-containing protein n=2 Tax=Gloeothece TaxID=28070 RepID=E0UHK5_GLOV7|nr:conserved hypothetical protein [Gloeothece verrucosa PCC 7822]
MQNLQLTMQNLRDKNMFGKINPIKPISFLPLVCLLVLLLTGCVRYDVGVNFDSQHHGEIVQHITLGQQLTSLSQTEAQKWLNSIQQRAKQLQGSAQKISPQEIIVSIPFSNGQDLVDKFNQFFNPNPEKANHKVQPENLDLVQLKSEMSIRQSNLLLLERNQLNLQVDLRALGVLSNQGNIIVSPGSLIDLELILNTPFGAKLIENQQGLIPDINNEGKQLVWHLIPGQINTIEAVFWVPSWLGIGTVVIIVLMIAGFYLKYGHFPGIEPSIKTATATK